MVIDDQLNILPISSHTLTITALPPKSKVNRIIIAILLELSRRQLCWCNVLDFGLDIWKVGGLVDLQIRIYNSQVICISQATCILFRRYKMLSSRVKL